MNRVQRRTVLRGLFQGASVAVALPYLDCFLNDNGTLLAAEGVPLPTRFGTWFWGLGVLVGITTAIILFVADLLPGANRSVEGAEGKDEQAYEKPEPERQR